MSPSVRPRRAAFFVSLFSTFNTSELQQVFNSLDPSLFLDRNLDDNAEDYIINSLDEFTLNTPLKLVFYLPCKEENTARHFLPSALHNYFDYRQQG